MAYFILTTLNGLLFAAWVVVMFRTLLEHRRRAAARTGAAFPGVKDTLQEWQHWWRDPGQQSRRRLLIGLTLALLMSLVLLVMRAPIG